MIMLIKNAEKLRKTTLRERIYEEVVHLILSGELPSGGWGDEKQVIERLRVSRTPFREAIGKGGLVEIKPYHGFDVRSFSRSETADLYELYKRLEAIRKFRAHRGAEAIWVANPALWHNLKRERGVCRAHCARIRRHHTSVQGTGPSARCFSRPRTHQPRRRRFLRVSPMK